MAEGMLTLLLRDISKILLENGKTHAQEETLKLLYSTLEACCCAVYLQKDKDYQLYKQYSPSPSHKFVSSLSQNAVDLSTSALYFKGGEINSSFFRKEPCQLCLILPLFKEGRPEGFLITGWDDISLLDCVSAEELRVLQPVSLLLSDIFCNFPLISALKQREKSLSALYQKAEQELDANRRQVSLELHDDVDQVLTSIIIQLKILQQSEDIEYIKGRISGLHHITLQTLEEVRRISRFLRPTLLEKLGLQASLEAYTKEYSDSTGITVEMRCHNLEDPIPTEVENIIYGAVQEGLTNVARHAAANAVLINLTKKANNLFLQIEDNGKGVDKVENNGLGLLGLKERVNLVKGKFWLFNRNGQGVSLNILLPLDILG